MNGKLIGGTIVAVGVGAAIYFVFVKKGVDNLSYFSRFMKKNDENQKDATTDTTTTTTTPPKGTGGVKTPLQTPTSDPVNNVPTPPSDTSPIGKNLYAKHDDVVKVYKVSDNSVYKTAKKNEYIGKISKVDGGAYLISSNLYRVWKSGVEIR